MDTDEKVLTGWLGSCCAECNGYEGDGTYARLIQQKRDLRDQADALRQHISRDTQWIASLNEQLRELRAERDAYHNNANQLFVALGDLNTAEFLALPGTVRTAIAQVIGAVQEVDM